MKKKNGVAGMTLKDLETQTNICLRSIRETSGVMMDVLRDQAEYDLDELWVELDTVMYAAKGAIGYLEEIQRRLNGIDKEGR